MRNIPGLISHTYYAKENPCAEEYPKIIFCKNSNQSACEVCPSYQTKYAPPLRAKTVYFIDISSPVNDGQCYKRNYPNGLCNVYKYFIGIFWVTVPYKNERHAA